MDLSILARNAAATPDERLDRAVQSQILMRTIQEMKKDAGR